MQGFRNFLQGPAGKILLGVILVPFVGIVFVDYFQAGSGAEIVAKVEGKPINRSAVTQRVQGMRQQVLQENPEIDPAMLDAYINPSMVLESMINNALVARVSEERGKRVSDEQVVRELARIPTFQEDGVFSEQLFERAVRGAGYTPRTYVGAIGEEMLIAQYKSAIEETEFALPSELNEIRRLGEQRRDIRYARVRLVDLRDAYSVSEEDIEEYYQRNQQRFVRPEQVQMSYVHLTPAVFEDQVEITDQDVADEYEARRQMYETIAAQREQREVAHIMLETGNKRSLDEARELAASLIQQLQAGADFDRLANEYSEDIATASMGGDLGPIERGALPEALEEAVFALQSGEFSDPVVSDGNVHILQVEKVESSSPPEFEDIKDDIRRELRTAALDLQLSEALIRLEELAFEHSDLEGPARELNLEIQQSDWFSLEQPKGLAQKPAVLRELRSDPVFERGFNSDVIDLDDGTFAVVRLADKRPPEPLPLDDVAENIRRTLQNQKASEQLAELSNGADELVSSGASLDAIAEHWDATVEKATDLERGGTSPNPQIVQRAFRAVTTEGAIEIFHTQQGDLVAMTLDAIRDGEVNNLTDQQQHQALIQLSRHEGMRAMNRALGYLRETQKIEKWPSRLEAQTDME